jgi:hypothetical protein
MLSDTEIQVGPRGSCRVESGRGGHVANREYLSTYRERVTNRPSRWKVGFAIRDMTLSVRSLSVRSLGREFRGVPGNMPANSEQKA